MTVRERLNEVLSRGSFQVLPVAHPTLRLFAQNVAGRPGIVIELEHPLGRDVADMRGLDILVEWPTPDVGYLRIASVRQGHSPGFLAVVEHLISEASRADPGQSAVHAVVDALEELRILFGRKRGRLGEDQIRGLYAELLMLERLLAGGAEPKAGLLAWHGPFGGSKDFVFPGGAATEVKSCHRPPARVVISNVDQLERGDLDLDLVVVPLERDTRYGARSLPELAAEMLRHLDGDVVAVELFDEALDAAGFDRGDAFYEQWAFEPGEPQWFAVTDDFPRIRADALDPAVSAVRFELTLAALSQFTTDPRF